MSPFFSFMSRFCMWERTRGLSCSSSGLFLLTWWSPAPSVFLRTTWSHSSVWLNKSVHS
jgi:hypothetical protein